METICPLCGRGEKHMRRGKPLYGHQVCKKCYYGFANRRQLAFIIDLVTFRIVTLTIGIVLGVIIVVAGAELESYEAAYLPLDIAFLGLFFMKDGFAGVSLGKALFGVRAMDVETGQPIGFGASFKRNLPLFIPFMPIIIAVRLSKGPRTGDGWAHSKVIWTKYADHPIFAVGPARPEVEQPQAAMLAELAAMPRQDKANPYQAPRT